MSSEPSSEERAPCPDCGAPLEPPGRFCVACGHRVGSDDVTDPEGATRTGTMRPPHDPASGGRPAPASGRGATRTCTGCGASNVYERELCHACGRDLDPAVRTAVPPRSEPRLAHPSRGRWPWRAWWVPVLAAGGLIALITAGLAVAELGPFASQPRPLDVVPFPAGEYPEAAERLALSDVAALSSAPAADGRDFTPDRMVDDDPATAWRGDAATLPEGADQTIDLLLEEPAWVSELVVANGDHHDAEAYEDSGRAQRVDLRFDGDLVVAATLLDQGRSPQILRLEEPMLTTSVRLEMVHSVPGTTHDEPALSTIAVRGHLADGPHAALARERAEERPAADVVTVTQSSGRDWLRPWARAGHSS